MVPGRSSICSITASAFQSCRRSFCEGTNILEDCKFISLKSVCCKTFKKWNWFRNCLFIIPPLVKLQVLHPFWEVAVNLHSWSCLSVSGLVSSNLFKADLQRAVMEWLFGIWLPFIWVYSSACQHFISPLNENLSSRFLLLSSTSDTFMLFAAFSFKRTFLFKWNLSFVSLSEQSILRTAVFKNVVKRYCTVILLYHSSSTNRITWLKLCNY